MGNSFLTSRSNLRTSWQLFGTFFCIGLLTFGGGYAMIPLISHELVHKRKWLKEEEFQEALTLASSLPGPIAPNLAFLCGNKVGKIPGALAGEFGCVLPSFLVILGIALGLARFFTAPLAQRFFAGAGAAVTGLVAASALRLGTRIARNSVDLLIAASALALILTLRVHPLLALVWAAMTGLVLHRIHHAS